MNNIKLSYSVPKDVRGIRFPYSIVQEIAGLVRLGDLFVKNDKGCLLCDNSFSPLNEALLETEGDRNKSTGLWFQLKDFEVEIDKEGKIWKK